MGLALKGLICFYLIVSEIYLVIWNILATPLERWSFLDIIGLKNIIFLWSLFCFTFHLLIGKFLLFQLWTPQFESTVNPWSANPRKWSNTLKIIHRLLLTNFLSVFDHFVGLVLRGLNLYGKVYSISEKTFLPVCT